MNQLIEYFMSMPLWGRIMAVLAIIFCVWWIFGKKVFWILSIVPFVLKHLFFLIYRIIECPIEFLHRKFGKCFSKLDEGWALIGEKIITKMERWYDIWHKTGVCAFGKILLGYIIVAAYFVIPVFFDLNVEPVAAGKKFYQEMEVNFLKWSSEKGWYEIKEETSESERTVDEQEQQNSTEEEQEDVIELVVCGLNSTLLVRQIPSTEASDILDNLYNGDVVIWSGEMVFSEVDEEKIEPWVKIQTEAGIEGWSRLAYLRPVEYKDIEYYVTGKQEIR